MFVEVRAIQAQLYREAVKRSLTIHTLQEYRQYLDLNIKFGEYCLVYILFVHLQ